MENAVITILVLLTGWFIHIRYQEVSKKRERFDTEYTAFKNEFFDFKDVLESEEISLNVYILSEYDRHKRAKDVFIHNLKGSGLKQFNLKWTEYEHKYNQIKDLGPFGIATAIAPDAYSLQNAEPGDPSKWERNRKMQINNIINELLEIAKIKIWL